MTAPTFPNVLVVGMHFRGAHAVAAVSSFLPPVELQLEREPQNPYDEFAIKVLYQGEHIGYVERGQAAFISPQIDAGQKYQCTVNDLMQKGKNLHPSCTIEPDYRPDPAEEDPASGVDEGLELPMDTEEYKPSAMTDHDPDPADDEGPLAPLPDA